MADPFTTDTPARRVGQDILTDAISEPFPPMEDREPHRSEMRIPITAEQPAINYMIEGRRRNPLSYQPRSVVPYYSSGHAFERERDDTLIAGTGEPHLYEGIVNNVDDPRHGQVDKLFKRESQVNKLYARDLAYRIAYPDTSVKDDAFDALFSDADRILMDKLLPFIPEKTTILASNYVPGTTQGVTRYRNLPYGLKSQTEIDKSGRYPNIKGSGYSARDEYINEPIPPAGSTVTLYPKGGRHKETLVHELFHAATVEKLDVGSWYAAPAKEGAPGVYEAGHRLRNLTRTLNRIRDDRYYRDANGSMVQFDTDETLLTPEERQVFYKSGAATGNTSETLAWAMTNPYMQSALKKIKLRGDVPHYKGNTIWDVFMDTLRSAWGDVPDQQVQDQVEKVDPFVAALTEEMGARPGDFLYRMTEELQQFLDVPYNRETMETIIAREAWRAQAQEEDPDG
jgi:hypothetical protein